MIRHDKNTSLFSSSFLSPFHFSAACSSSSGAAANCCGLSPRQWLLYAAWLRCDHWRRRRSFVESKFSPVQPFTQTTGSVFIFYHIIVSREVSTIHVSEPWTDWTTPLIRNKTNNNRNWYSIECPKFGLQSLLYGFESNESFMFFLQILCSACILAIVAIFCDYLCLVYECVFPSPVSPRQPLDRHCPAFLLIQFSIICICISIGVFVFVHLYFYFCPWTYIFIWTGTVPPFS